MDEQLIEKARAAKSAEELMAIAKENGMELTEEKAAEYFAQLNKSGELSDDELDSVAGGGCQAEALAHKSNDLKVGDVIRCFNWDAFDDHYETCSCGNTYFRITKITNSGQNQVHVVCTKCGRTDVFLNERGYSYTRIIV